MTDKKFDDHIKGLMKDHEVEYDQLSWFSLENRLEETVGEQMVEEKIQEKLKNHQVRYQPSHWALLKQKLDLQDELKRKIYFTKLAEITILLLLLISFIHLKPFERIDFEPSQKTEINQNNSLQNAPRVSNQQMVDKSDTPSQLIDSESTDLVVSSQVTEVDAKDRIHKPTAENLQLVDIPALLNFENLSSLSIQSARETDDYLEKSFAKLSGVMAITPIVEHYETSEESRLELAAGSRLENELSMVSYNVQAPVLDPIKPAESPKRRRFGVFTSFDLNVINRPLDLRIFQQPEQYGAFGSSFGIQYSSQKGHHEFETGIAYSKKTYDPNLKEQVNVHSSYYERDFKEMTFQTLQIPFNYKWHSTTKKGWNVFGLIGTDINLVGATEYEFDNILKNGQPRSKNAIENNSKLVKTRDFHEGLFQGGQAVKNIYLTGTIGFGLERYIGNHSIYIQPQYKHHLFTQQLGPNNEKLNALSLQIGTKFKLN